MDDISMFSDQMKLVGYFATFVTPFPLPLVFQHTPKWLSHTCSYWFKQLRIFAVRNQIMEFLLDTVELQFIFLWPMSAALCNKNVDCADDLRLLK